MGLLNPITAASIGAAPATLTVYAESFRDGVRTDAQILTAAVGALVTGGCLKLGQGVTYTLTAGLSYDLTSRPNVLIDGQGAIINVAGIATGTTGIQFQGGNGSVVTALTAAITARAKSLTVTSTTGFAVGDMVQVLSSGEPANPDRSTYVKQELVRVSAIPDGVTLTLEARTWETYSLTSYTVSVKKIPAMKNLRIQDLNIVGDNAGTDLSGMQINYFDGLVLNNVTVTGCGTGGLAGSTGLDWRATNCRVQGSNRVGVGYGFHVVYAQNVKFIGCFGHGNRHSFDVDDTRDILYQGCTATGDLSCGISTHGNTDTAKFVNNTIKDCGGGIVSRGKNATITGNHITGSRTTTDTSESYVQGITLGDDGAHTWGVGYAGTGLTIADNRIDISGPNWTGLASFGIYCTAALVNATIRDNYISGYSSHGIYAKGDYGTNVTIKGNSLDGSGQLGTLGTTIAHGILLEPAHVVSGNTLNDVTVENNRISSALYNGIRVRGNPTNVGPVSDNLVFRHNTVGTTGQDRVYVADGYYGARIEVWGNEWLGISSAVTAVAIAAQSSYVAPPFVGANGWATRGVRFLGDGQQMGRMRPGVYYGPAYTGTAISAPTLSRIYTVPFFVDRTLTLDRLGVNVTTAGAASCVVRLGVYADVLDAYGGYPGALVTGSDNTVPGDAIALAVVGVSLKLTPGLYWLAACSQGGTPSMTVCSGIASQMVGAATTTVSGRTSWTQDSVTGALPTSFSTTLSSQGSPPLIQARIA